MDISSQLRIILLLAGAVVWAAIYYFGKRRAARLEPHVNSWNTDTRQLTEPEFLTQDDPVLDEEELDTPAYMRKQPQHEVHFNELEDELDEAAVAVPVYGLGPGIVATRYEVHEQHDEPRIDAIEIDDELVASEAAFSAQTIEPVFVHAGSDHFQMSDVQFTSSPDEPVFEAEPVIEPVIEKVEAESEWPHQTEVPTIPAVSVVVESPASQLRPASERNTQTSSAAPTLSEAVTPVAHNTTSQRPVSRDEKSASPASRRKIIALRLAMPERVSGVQLLALLQSERLAHGRFSIFHRVHGAGTVFSLASMVEPGTFDLEAMAQQQFPGVTFFMLLPGPLDGLIAYDQMLSCAQRLAHATGGILQDERGNKLTPQFMERLREEVLDFQHLMGSIAEPG